MDATGISRVGVGWVNSKYIGNYGIFMGVEVNDGVIAGDVHYTTVTNSHAVMEKKEDVKLSWWGVMVTRNQYFSHLLYLYDIGWNTHWSYVGRK